MIFDDSSWDKWNGWFFMSQVERIVHHDNSIDDVFDWCSVSITFHLINIFNWSILRLFIKTLTNLIDTILWQYNTMSRSRFRKVMSDRHFIDVFSFYWIEIEIRIEMYEQVRLIILLSWIMFSFLSLAVSNEVSIMIFSKYFSRVIGQDILLALFVIRWNSKLVYDDCNKMYRSMFCESSYELKFKMWEVCNVTTRFFFFF